MPRLGSGVQRNEYVSRSAGSPPPQRSVLNGFAVATGGGGGSTGFDTGTTGAVGRLTTPTGFEVPVTSNGCGRKVCLLATPEDPAGASLTSIVAADAVGAGVSKAVLKTESLGTEGVDGGTALPNWGSGVVVPCVGCLP